MAHLLQPASYGSVAAVFLQSLHGTQHCVCRFRSSNAGQPIVRPCSLTGASVTYQRFCVAAGSGAVSPGASSTLTFGLVRVPHCRSTGHSPGPTDIEVFGLGSNGSPESLSTYSRLHLADSGCRLMVRNLRTPCSSLHKCSSVFSVFPNQTSSSQFTLYLPRSSLDPGTPSPDEFAETGGVHLGAVIPKHFTRSSPVSSYMIPAKDPATVSYHPTDQRMVRLQPASNPRFSPRASLCAASPPWSCWPFPWRP